MLKKNCIVCGEEFIKRENESLKNWNNRHKFCSQHCVWTYHQNGKETRFGKRKYTPWLKGTNGVMVSNKNQLDALKIGQKTATRNLEKWRKDGGIVWNKNRPWLEMRGSNHPGWKNGITKLASAIRMTFEYKEWRRKVFERDGYKCIICGGHHIIGDRRNLHSHHIIPFYKLLIDNKITTLEEARNCKALWEISNGQTLCIPCHKQTDSYLVNQYNKT